MSAPLGNVQCQVTKEILELFASQKNEKCAEHAKQQCPVHPGRMARLLPEASPAILLRASFWMAPRDSLSYTQMFLEGPKTISKACLVSGHPISSSFPSFFPNA